MLILPEYVQAKQHDMHAEAEAVRNRRRHRQQAERPRSGWRWNKRDRSEGGSI